MKRKGIYDLRFAIYDLLFKNAAAPFRAGVSAGRLYFTLLFLFFFKISFSQTNDSTQGTFSINAHLHYGYLVPHRPSMIGLLTGHTVGFELDFIKTSDGSKTFERAYNYPELGISYCYFNVGNEKVLGEAQAVYPFVSFPLARNKHLQFNLRVGGGLGYIQKSFDRYENFKNNAIGSHLNGVMSLRAELQCKISMRSKLGFQWGLTHWSNGSAAIPNLGINVTTMSLSYQHYFGKQQKINRDTLSAVVKKIRTSFYVAAFHKEIIPAGGDKYFVSTIYGNVGKVLSHKSTLGGGIDIFYNAAIIESLKRQDETTKPIDAWRMGLHVSYMLSISDFDMVFENGVYVFGQLDGDTYLYTRLGMRQKIAKHIFLCVNLKTHFAKADFFEFGIGYER
ncbi:MAG: acyloxyacyl hydrolase [Bacteroidia bacterium]